jgi:hypothetical protein
LRIGGGDEPKPEDAVAEAFAAFGLVADKPLSIDEDFYLWPENEPVFWLWIAVQTQWRIGDGVRHALDYPGVKVVMQMRGMKKREQGSIFSLIQMMEIECLNEWARKRS